jgi:hypothetical protein
MRSGPPRTTVPEEPPPSSRASRASSVTSSSTSLNVRTVNSDSLASGLHVSGASKLRVTGAETEHTPLYLRRFFRVLSSWVHDVTPQVSGLLLVRSGRAVGPLHIGGPAWVPRRARSRHDQRFLPWARPRRISAPGRVRTAPTGDFGTPRVGFAPDLKGVENQRSDS